MVAAAITMTSAKATVDLPYSNDFSSGWGAITVDGDFTLSSYGGYGYSQCAYFSDASAAQSSIVLPEMSFEPGLVYEVSYFAKSAGQAVGKWRLDGSTVVDEVTIESSSFVQHKFKFHVETAGNSQLDFYLYGGSGAFYIDNISVSAGVDGGIPAAPSVTEVQHGIAGDKLQASFDITVPTENFAGNALTGDVTVTVTRSDDNTFNKVETVAPGGVCAFVDNDAPLSRVEYTVVCGNEAGESESVTVVSNPAFALPGAVDNVVVSVTDRNKFVLTWDAVDKGATDGLFIPSQVRYTVSCGKTIIEDCITGTTATYTYPMPDEGQDAVTFTIVASNSRGNGEIYTSGTYLVGYPYVGEFHESGVYANYSRSYSTSTWVVEGSSNSWTLSAGSYSPSIAAQDNDECLIKFNAYYEGTLVSPVLDLTTLKNPMIGFYVYQEPGAYYSPSVQAGFRVDGADIMVGEPIVYNEGVSNGWNEFILAVPSEALAKECQLIFKGYGTSGNVYVDNISIKSYLGHNAAVTTVSVPQSVELGSEITLSATILNKGVSELSGYTVDFSVAGETIGTLSENLPVVASQAEIAVSFPYVVHPRYAGNDVTVTVTVNYDADEDVTDNQDEATMTVNENAYPVAEALKAVVIDDNDVALEWTAPEVSSDPVQEQLTEDFETYDAYATDPEIPGWTFVNNNSVAKSAFNNKNGNTVFTVMIGENYTTTYSGSFESHSGNQALIITNPYYSYSSSNDDWMISPVVQSGSDVSFFAKACHSWSTSYKDNLSVYWSAGGTDITDFTLLETFEVTATAWNQYQVTLPAEAKRFAIHFEGAMSNNAIAIDDLTYVSETSPLEHLGYNIYRDNVKIGTVGADKTSFVDENAAAARAIVYHDYFVTSLYDRGESMPSGIARASITVSVTTESISACRIEAVDGAIGIKGCKGENIVVYDLSGRVVYSAVVNDSVTVPVAGGVYIVSVGSSTVKVAVK